MFEHFRGNGLGASPTWEKTVWVGWRERLRKKSNKEKVSLRKRRRNRWERERGDKSEPSSESYGKERSFRWLPNVDSYCYCMIFFSLLDVTSNEVNDKNNIRPFRLAVKKGGRLGKK